jgi:hypothetical protein
MVKMLPSRKMGGSLDMLRSALWAEMGNPVRQL